ncbi:MAG TPA: ribonuclease H-like domain-containing protein [Candidatus Paceibacterota bacterium]
MRRITFDIETANDFADLFEPAKLDLALICIHDSETDSYSSYRVEELPKLWPILEKADVLIGYNSDHFDIPVLGKYYPGDLTKIRSLDLLKEVRNVLGRRLKLDNLCQATLGAQKSGDGAQAVRWWREGKVEKVRAYCLNDVRLTKELYDYALKNGTLKYKDFDGVRDIKLDTSHWEKGEGNALTHTLPF